MDYTDAIRTNKYGSYGGTSACSTLYEYSMIVNDAIISYNVVVENGIISPFLNIFTGIVHTWLRAA